MRYGLDHGNYKTGRAITTQGYVSIICRGHPLAYKCGRALEHRVVYWDTYGPFAPGAIIHHLNGIKTDNRPGNLGITNKAMHCQGHTRGARHPYVTSEQMRKAGKIAAAKRTPEERKAIGRKIHQTAMNRTPEQRRAFGQKTRERLARLSAEERQAIGKRLLNARQYRNHTAI